MSLPHRVAGNLALDLANTISWRGTDREIDHLATPADILAWSRAAGLTDGHFAVRPADHKALMKGILDLRLAIGEVGSAIAAGKPPPRAALDIIRDYAAKALRTASLQGRPVSLRFQGIDSITGAVAWSALDLLRSDELSRLKQCPSDDCRWLFIDRTKNGSRRWCEMSTCGNRAKKQAFRRGPS
ncbi:hypothetical protein E4K66_32060 [Bradyrhizobium frederickii]|uniref:Zinc finger CGNR domain-containing protein n=1 Tax=Bradyrhizobium frederickii TaxID=2560054 RepID=A0A4Y9KX72_9BRAD|nr:ABATE domain-containing protein [Bradyrhizobium frederickii]TFV30990.1 hypothetical protein E4K66_32060 [Bradyrhizobium frederickii]